MSNFFPYMLEFLSESWYSMCKSFVHNESNVLSVKFRKDNLFAKIYFVVVVFHYGKGIKTS